MQKAIAYVKYVAKAIAAIAVPILWEAAIEIVEVAQGSFADEPYVSLILGAIAVYLVRNGPKPE